MPTGSTASNPIDVGGVEPDRRSDAGLRDRGEIGAGDEVAPERPVLAFLLEHNVASRRTAEKVGLRLVWRGPDDGNPDPDAVRLVFLDREPDDLFVAEVATEGWDPQRFLR